MRVYIGTTQEKNDDRFTTLCIFLPLNKQKGSHLTQKRNLTRILHLGKEFYRLLQWKLQSISIWEHKLHVINTREL